MMKQLAFIILVLSGCAEPTPKQATPAVIQTASATDSAAIAQMKNGRYIYETISSDSILLNDKVPFEVTVAALKEMLGEPDSIVASYYECDAYFDDGAPSEIYYYGPSHFEVCKGKAVFREVRFDSGDFYLKTPRLIFRKGLQLSEVEKLFPLSVKQALDMPPHKEGPVFKHIKILQHKDDDAGAWMVEFHDEQLISVYYWIGC